MRKLNEENYMDMTVEEAIRILDPETSKDAINEIKYYAGFNKDKLTRFVVVRKFFYSHFLSPK